MPKVPWPVVLVALLFVVGVFGIVWLAWDQPQFYAGLLGALIGAASAFGATWLTQRYARERDAAEYRRTIASARIERLRGHYTALVRSAMALEEASMALQYLAPGDTTEQRDARVYNGMYEVLENLDAAIAATRLEPGTEDVLREWGKAFGTFTYVRHIVESNTREPQTFPMKDLIHKLGELKAAVSNLTGLASAHLDSLERAAPAPFSPSAASRSRPSN